MRRSKDAHVISALNDVGKGLFNSHLSPRCNHRERTNIRAVFGVSFRGGREMDREGLIISNITREPYRRDLTGVNDRQRVHQLRPRKLQIVHWVNGLPPAAQCTECFRIFSFGDFSECMKIESCRNALENQSRLHTCRTSIKV